MYHDIDYLSQNEPIFSDIRAIRDNITDWSLNGVALKLGLTARSLLDALYHIAPGLYFNPTHINGRNDDYNMSDEELVMFLRNKANEL